MPISYKNLFILMEKKGIKKIDLRNKYNFNPKTVDSLTKNKSVTVDTIIRLCEILDCEPGDILERTTSDSPCNPRTSVNNQHDFNSLTSPDLPSESDRLNRPDMLGRGY